MRRQKKATRLGAFHSLAAQRQLIAHLLAQMLPPLLRIQRALGGEAGFQSFQADFFARVDAVAVTAVLDALERAVDLVDQLAITVARTQFQRVLGFAGGALGFVADVAYLFL